MLAVGSLETELWLQVQTIQCIRQRSLHSFPARSVPSSRSKSKVWQWSLSEQMCEQVVSSSAAQIVPFSPSSNNSLFISLSIALLPCTGGYTCLSYKILCIMSDLHLTCKAYCTNFSLPFFHSLSEFFTGDWFMLVYCPFASFCLFTDSLNTNLNGCCGHHYVCHLYCSSLLKFYHCICFFFLLLFEKKKTAVFKSLFPFTISFTRTPVKWLWNKWLFQVSTHTGYP